MTTTPATQTLADWLLQRLDEDEAAARAELALRGSGTRHPIGHPCDPARGLDEVAAKRAVLAVHTGDEHECEEEYGPMVFDSEPSVEVGVDDSGQPFMRHSIGTTTVLPCPTLRHLASVYSDHPDYDPSWAVS